MYQFNGSLLTYIGKRKVSFMGDSITWNTNTEIAPIAAKWMTLIQGRIEITAYNQGISGQQTSTMVQNFATTVLAYKPDICFLEEACNDALWWRDGNGTKHVRIGRIRFCGAAKKSCQRNKRRIKPLTHL